MFGLVVGTSAVRIASSTPAAQPGSLGPSVRTPSNATIPRTSSRPRRARTRALVAASCLAACCGCGSNGPAVTTTNPGRLVVSTTSLSFGAVEIGQNAAATVSLSNPGTKPIQISKVQIAGQSFSLSGKNATPITINGGYAYSLDVEFAPTAAGAASGSITLTTNASPATVTITLSGHGLAEPVGPALQLQSTTVAFGNVMLNTPATQSVEVTSSGSSPLVISGVTVTGKPFQVAGATFPLTLNPAQSVTLTVTFDPTAAGASTGLITLTSNATPAKATVALSGTGETRIYQVDLSWDSPSSSRDPVTGYRVYREASGDSSYLLLNATPVDTTSYKDTNVAGGATYKYYVESVDADGNSSAPSNVFTISVPE